MITPQIQHSTRTSSTQPAVGVLLVHGLNGNTGDMAELEDILRKQSIITKNMLLPGHGSKVKDMLSIGWDEWAQAVHDELSELKELCDVVFARDGRQIYQLIGSREKHLVTLHRSYHVVMKDHDREEVFDKTLAFVLHHAKNANPHRHQSTTNQTA